MLGDQIFRENKGIAEADPVIKLTAAQHKKHISKGAWSKGCAVATPIFYQ